jgi:hypothetical protein
VSVRASGRTVEANTDARGLYTFRNLLPGQYELRAQLAGFRTHAAALKVASGQWSSGDVTLRVGPIEPHDIAIRWKLRRSEIPVRVKTALGDISFALARNDFVACVDANAYTAGRLELLSTSPIAAGPAQLLFRLHHGADKPAAPDAPVYGLRFDDAGHLVVLDRVRSQVLAVEGRVVEGFDVIDRIRALANASTTPVTLEILSIGRLGFL